MPSGCQTWPGLSATLRVAVFLSSRRLPDLNSQRRSLQAGCLTSLISSPCWLLQVAAAAPAPAADVCCCTAGPLVAQMARTLPLRSGSTLSVMFSSVMAPGSASSVAIWSGWLQVATAGHSRHQGGAYPPVQGGNSSASRGSLHGRWAAAAMGGLPATQSVYGVQAVPGGSLPQLTRAAAAAQVAARGGAEGAGGMCTCNGGTRMNRCQLACSLLTRCATRRTDVSRAACSSCGSMSLHNAVHSPPVVAAGPLHHVGHATQADAAAAARRPPASRNIPIILELLWRLT